MEILAGTLGKKRKLTLAVSFLLLYVQKLAFSEEDSSRLLSICASFRKLRQVSKIFGGSAFAYPLFMGNFHLLVRSYITRISTFSSPFSILL
jgi:hypothetical protein